jgi:hypothetical protein
MIASTIVERAETILTSQSFIPLSPAAEGAEGELCLCAAASLALAGIEEKIGGKAADEFRASIRSMSRRGLEDVFVELEWAPELCAAMRACNDSAPPERRLDLVVARLKELGVQ